MPAHSPLRSRGYQATSMEEVASRAGVTRLIVYRHFNSKEDLYRAVLDRAVRGVALAVSGHGEGGPTVGSVVNGFLDAAAADPEGFKLLVRHSARGSPTSRATPSSSEATPSARLRTSSLGASQTRCSANGLREPSWPCSKSRHSLGSNEETGHATRR